MAQASLGAVAFLRWSDLSFLGTFLVPVRRAIVEIHEDRQGPAYTIVTSPLPVEDWHRSIGDLTLADAMLDRQVHNAHRLELDGHSTRRAGGPSENIDEGQRA